VSRSLSISATLVWLTFRLLGEPLSKFGKLNLLQSTDRQLARGGLKNKPDAPENEPKYVRSVWQLASSGPVLANLPPIKDTQAKRQLFLRPVFCHGRDESWQSGQATAAGSSEVSPLSFIELWMWIHWTHHPSDFIYNPCVVV
jgi:hypothetical protein